MSGSITPLPGAERIRALVDEDAIFNAFDAYPWKKDAMFMSGLAAMLGDPSDFDTDAAPRINNMATQARIFYYAQRVGVVIDYTKYYAWLEKHPEHKRPMFHADLPAPGPNDVSVSDLADKLDRLSTVSGKGKEVLAEPDDEPVFPPQRKDKGKEVMREPEVSSASPPSWQMAAPKAKLYVDRKDAQAPPSPPRDGQSPDEPSYPLRFAEMLRMLEKDIPIPGIRQIPDTVVRDPTAKPFGARVAPRKPWEQMASGTIPVVDYSTPSEKAGLEFPSTQESTGQ